MHRFRAIFKNFLRAPGADAARRIWGRWQLSRRPDSLPEPIHEEIAYDVDRPFGARVLLTSRSGVLLYQDDRMHRILGGRFYGLSPCAGRWYVSYQPTEFFGQIISFELRQGRACDVRCELPFLDPQIHQIDFCRETLFITETGRNRLLCVPTANLSLRHARCIYPNGEAPRHRESPNYAHINSVLNDGESTLLVFHNHTHKTGRRSELVCLDADMQLRGRRTLDAGCVHNVVVVDGNVGYCDSQRGDFILGQRRLPLGVFTRGVAVDEDRLFVGGSEFTSRDKRGHSPGALFCCARDASAVHSRMRLPDVGGIYEIRQVESTDLGLSEHYRQHPQRQVRLREAFDQLIDCESDTQVAAVTLAAVPAR